MRASRFLFATLRETPNDAEVISHQLMLRAGMIRKLASGLYTWLPMGVRVLNKVAAIVHEEMNNAGSLEVLMPVTHNTARNCFVSKTVTATLSCLVLPTKKS